MTTQASPSSATPSHRSAAERVLVLDFGSQYAQLIARRVRELQVFCEIVRHDISAERLREIAPRGIILSGGPASVYAPGAPQCDSELFQLGIPVLGICYGMQLACQALGGHVDNTPSREYGRAHCRIVDGGELFDGLSGEMQVWMSHGDQVAEIADVFEPLAQTDTCPYAAIRHRQLPIFGLQFHPEVTHTPEGGKVLGNFLRKVCGTAGTWKLGDFAAETITEVRQRVGNDRVICGLSGGVDSSVVGRVDLPEAIGAQLSCILVDNGLLRQDEADVGDPGVQPTTSGPTCTWSKARGPKFLSPPWPA